MLKFLDFTTVTLVNDDLSFRVREKRDRRISGKIEKR